MAVATIEMYCPDCGSAGARACGEGELWHCENCGARFERDSARLRIGDLDEVARIFGACTCDEVRACPPCFGRAEAMVGARVRDCYGREWFVDEVGEKDGYPTICGGPYWRRPDDVEVIEPASW